MMDYLLKWQFFNRFIVAFIQFAILLVFVRFVSPHEMGLAIICLGIFYLINSLVIRLSEALLQNKDADDLDYSSILIAQIVLAILLYSFLFISSETIASWLGHESLANALRIIGVTLFFYAISSLYTVRMKKSLHYSAILSNNVGSAFITAIICFFLAIFQYGLYAILLWPFFYQFFSVLMIFLFYDWYPRIGFSFHRIKNIVIKAPNAIVPSVLESLFTTGQKIAVGTFFNPVALSFYVRGQRMPGLFLEISRDVREKLRKEFTTLRDDSVKLQLKMRETVVQSEFLVLPLMTFLLVLADPLILLLFGEQWVFATPFVKMFCVYYALMPIASFFLQALIVLNIKNRYLKIELLTKGILLILWLGSFQIGLHAVAVSMIVYVLIRILLYQLILKSTINYSMVQMVKDLAPIFILSTSVGILIFLLQLVLPSSILLICVQFFIGILLYGTLAYFFRPLGWQLFVKIYFAFYEQFRNRRIRAKKSPTV